MANAEAGHQTTGPYDLVMISIPGVQRFIDEVRSTADARAASEIMMRLAVAGARGCAEAVSGVIPVFPATPMNDHPAERVSRPEREVSDGDGAPVEIANAPNRIVVLVPPDGSESVARAAADAIVAEWHRVLRRVFDLSESEPVPATPGMPVVAWVRVQPSDGEDGYADQWSRAQAAMAARRRLRDFPALEIPDAELCDLSPRWAATPREALPPGLKKHEEARLAPANWVKRRWKQVDGVVGFPSTSSIASAPFRREVDGAR